MTNEGIKYIDKVKGPLVRLCPGAINHLCCGYVVVSHILNCPYNCSYCYLHTFFGKDEIVVFNNEEEVVKQVKTYLEKSEDMLRVGTGEYSDSLAMPEAVSLGRKLVKLFAAQKKHFLELKTKSDNVSELFNLKHNGQTVIAWSLNPEKIAKEEELGAPSLARRLAAAKKCVKAGYPVAFHFDPIIFYPGWEKDYEEVVDLIFSNVSEKDIAWISLGALRFPAAQQEIMEKKFKTKIPFDHLSRGLDDNKLRYPESLRVELFGHVYNLIRSVAKEVYIYLCMENGDVWQKSKIKNEANNPYKKYFKFFKK